jgi:hypothetical protein
MPVSRPRRPLARPREASPSGPATGSEALGKCGLIVTRVGRKVGFPSPCSGAKCAAFFARVVGCGLDTRDRLCLALRRAHFGSSPGALAKLAADWQRASSVFVERVNELKLESIS